MHVCVLQPEVAKQHAHAEAIFGRTRADALGQRLAETIIPPRYREAHDRGLRHFLATGEVPCSIDSSN